jgi:DNA-binding response OmpR family regulator
MFSTCANEVDVAMGLEIGADDYIAKILSLCVSW